MQTNQELITAANKDKLFFSPYVSVGSLSNGRFFLKRYDTGDYVIISGITPGDFEKIERLFYHGVSMKKICVVAEQLGIANIKKTIETLISKGILE